MTSELLEGLASSIAQPVANDLYRAVADGRRSVALRILRDEGLSFEEQKAAYRELAVQFRGPKVRLEEIPPDRWLTELATENYCLGRYAGVIHTTVAASRPGQVICGIDVIPASKLTQLWAIRTVTPSAK